MIDDIPCDSVKINQDKLSVFHLLFIYLFFFTKGTYIEIYREKLNGLDVCADIFSGIL